MPGEIGHRPPPELLELLGQLAGNRARPGSAPASGELTQRRSDSPRRLVQHARVRGSGDLGQRFRPLATASREEAEKSKPLGAEARRGQCREQRGGPRNRDDVHPGFDGTGDDPRAGIGQQWRAGVRDERNVLARGQPLEDLRGGLSFIVLVVRADGGGYVVVLE